MNALHGNCPVDGNYKLISCDYTGEEYKVCENCGALINTVAVIKSYNGTQYSVGSDCAQTLTEHRAPGTYWQLKQQLKVINRNKRYFALARKLMKNGSVVKSEYGATFYEKKGITEWSSQWKLRLSTDQCKLAGINL